MSANSRQCTSTESGSDSSSNAGRTGRSPQHSSPTHSSSIDRSEVQQDLLHSIKRDDDKIWEEVLGRPSPAERAQYAALKLPGIWAEAAGFELNVEYLVEKHVLPVDHRFRRSPSDNLCGSPQGCGPDAVLLLPRGSGTGIPHPEVDTVPSAAELWDQGTAEDRTESHLACAFALKGCKKEDYDQATIDRQSVDLLLLLMRQAARANALTFSFANDFVRLFYGSSSGVIISSPISVHSQEADIVYLLVALSALTLEQFGCPFDTRYDFPCDASIPALYSEIFPKLSYPQSRTISIHDILQRRARIVGRGTTAYKVSVPSASQTLQVVLKSTFTDTTREDTELDVFRHLQRPSAARHPGLATLRAAWRAPPVLQDFALPHWNIRSHTFLLIKPQCYSLWAFTGPAPLTGIVRDVVSAHAFLASSGFFHRDVSIGNVMAYTDADNDVRGILIDFDLAAPIRTSLRLSTPNRPTGTLPFMARELCLISNERAVQQHSGHDMESLFYVMCWVIIHDFKPSKPLKGVGLEIVDMWNSGGYKARASKGEFRASSETLYLEWIGWGVVPHYYSSFYPFFRNFQKAIFDREGRFSHDDLLLALA